jgi:hypothetical protein
LQKVGGVGVSERPGIMLYFDTVEPLLSLDDKTFSALLRASIMYGKYGELPQFDGVALVLWGMIKPTLDRDDIAYENKRMSGRYAAHCRAEKAAGRVPVSFDEWKRIQTTVNDHYGSLPISISTPTPVSLSGQEGIAGKGSAEGKTQPQKSENEFSTGFAQSFQQSDFDERKREQMELLARYGGSGT